MYSLYSSSRKKNAKDLNRVDVNVGLKVNIMLVAVLL